MSRVALVTGANRGLGAGFVEALLDRGADRVYAGARDLTTLHEARQRHGDRLVPIQLDVTVPAAVEAAAAGCPDVDLLVCNAGRTCVGPVVATPDEADFRDAFEVNFFGPLTLTRCFAPVLRRNAGELLFVGSLSGLLISRSSPIYSATKAALLMLAAGVRNELAADGVRVTSTLPGFIDTEMTTGMAVPKASPRDVADASLDGLAAGETVVFPDPFAAQVEQALVTDMSTVLREPQQVATRVVRAFRQTPAPSGRRPPVSAAGTPPPASPRCPVGP